MPGSAPQLPLIGSPASTKAMREPSGDHAGCVSGTFIRPLLGTGIPLAVVYRPRKPVVAPSLAYASPSAIAFVRMYLPVGDTAELLHFTTDELLAAPLDGPHV